MGLLNFFKKVTSQALNVQEVKNDIREEQPVVKTQENNEQLPSLQSRLSKATPTKNGLYPHEILMLEYAHTYKNTKNQFQNFWKWNYSVEDPQAVLNSLLQRGFIVEGDLRSSIGKLKVADLKELLTKVNGKTTGKKEELIERVFEVYSEEALEKMFPERYYELTAKGAEELSQNEYVSYLHRNSYMSTWEMNYYLNNDNPSHLGYRDILWREFNKQSGEHFQNYDFGLYRNTRLSMHNFLMEEDKYKTAMHMLVEVASFDLSGLGNGDRPGRTDQSCKEIIYESKLANLFFDEEEATLPPGIVNYFKKLYELLDMSEDEFVKYIYDEFADIKIHERVFLPDECANIVLSTLGIEERKIKDSKKVAELRLKKILSL